MQRREFLKKSGALAAGALAQGLFPAPRQGNPSNPKSPGRPNLLFLFSDQQSHDMVGYSGNKHILTPQVDQLAKDGLRFTQCVSQYPICSPFRAMLLSGQHPLYNGCYENEIQMLPGRSAYFGEILRDAGYRTGYIGKWHILGGPVRRPIPAGALRYGFDQTFLTNNCTMDFQPGSAFFYNEKGEKVIYPEWEPYGQARQAMDFIDEAPADKPWALFVSWHAPHDHNLGGKNTYQAPPDLMGLYDRKAISIRPETDEALFAERQRQSAPKYNGHGLDLREDYHGYYAMCTGVDIALGKILGKLKQKGLDQNTIVVYTSDHGCSMGAWTRDIQDVAKEKGMGLTEAASQVFCGTKGTPHDWSTRTPLVIRWPRRLKPNLIPGLFGTLDFMPTLLGLMDLGIPQTCQGRDLSSQLINGTSPVADTLPIFTHWYRGVHSDRYTFALTSENSGFFWDRQKDPLQQHNIFNSPSKMGEYRDVIAGLRAETLKYLGKFKDRFPSSKALSIAAFGLPPSADAAQIRKARVEGGVLKGRPIDLIQDLPSVLSELN